MEKKHCQIDYSNINHYQLRLPDGYYDYTLTEDKDDAMLVFKKSLPKEFRRRDLRSYVSKFNMRKQEEWE